MINFASRAEYRNRIERVVVYINQHLADSLDYDTLTSISQFSSFHFDRIFQGALGETPQAYINRLRVERAAKSLIASKNMSVTDVATACGFSSQSTFAEAFKSHFGVSASEYAQGRYLQSLADSCSVQAGTMASGEKPIWNVTLDEMDGQTCAVFRVECRADEVEALYLSIYRNWLPDSGFLPTDSPTYEVYLQSPEKNGDDLCRMDIHIPVKPLF